MKLYWATDLHLEFLENDAEIDAFLRSYQNANPHGILIGGDTHQSSRNEEMLEILMNRFEAPVYFVLGNHDFYGSSIKSVRYSIQRAHKTIDRLHYLPNEGMIRLTDDAVLVGQGGWGDARLGRGTQTEVTLNDQLQIEDFINRSEEEQYSLMRSLGDEAAEHLKNHLPEAAEEASTVIILTHVPPFRQATRYEGKVSDPEYLSLFACKATGEVIRETARNHPGVQFLVLCGHTHHPADEQIRENLRVVAGSAEYEDPKFQKIVSVRNGDVELQPL